MKALFHFSFFLLVASSVTGQDLRDTAWAQRLVKKADELITARKYEKILNILDTAQQIYLNINGIDSEGYGAVLHIKGRYYLNINLFDSSIVFTQKAISIRESILQQDHPETAKSYNNLGLVYQAQGKFDKAIECHQKALDIRAKVFGVESCESADSYNNLGIAYRSKSNKEKALELIKKALEIRISCYEPNNVLIANSYSNLGAYYNDLGEFDLAIEYSKKALGIFIRSLGENHPEVARCWDNLGGNYRNKGDIKQALRFHQDALNLRLRTLNPESPEIATSYNNIGSAYFEMGDYDNAISSFKQSLFIRSKILGVANVEVGSAHFNIGIAHIRKGAYKQANSYLFKALGILLNNLGPNHPHVAQVYMSIAVSYSETFDYERAIEYNYKALKILSNTFGPTHPYIAVLYNNIGVCLDGFGDYDRSIDFFKKALSLNILHYGEASFKIAQNYHNIGGVYLSKKDYTESINFFNKSLEIYLKNPDYIPNEVAEVYSNLGIANRRLKECDKAISFCKKSLDIKRRQFGGKHPTVAGAYINLGACYYCKDSLQESINMFKKSIDANNGNSNNLESILSINTLIEAYQNIGNIYREMNTTKHIMLSRASYKNSMKSIRYERQKLIKRNSSNSIIINSITTSQGIIATDYFLYDITDSLEYLYDAFITSEESRSFSLYESLRESDALHFAGIPDTLLQQEYDLRIDIAYQEKKRFEEEIEKQKPLTDSILLVINSTLFDLKRSYEALKDTFEQQYPDYYRLKYDQRVESIPDVQASLLQPGQALLEYFAGDSSIFIFLVKKDDYRVFEVKKDFPLEDWVKQLRFGIYGYHTAPDWLKSAALRDSALHEYISAATALYQKLLAPVDSLLPRRVVIVPDGILGYIPFEALLTAQPARKDRFQLYPYFGRAKGREHSISYSYSATLLREMTARKHRQAPTGSLLAYAPYYDGDTTLLATRFIDPANPANRLPALVYAAEEVRQLHDLLGGKAVIGRSARKDSLLREAGRYRILHLSTHGKANDKVGDYSFLAFSEVKDSLENEWLYVRDIYNLSLNADLVVLSACETGIGELKRGEGIISLARAFAYAGAKSIVTTLWSVDDAKTRDLMVFFYQNLKNGMTKDEALARARNDYFSQHKGTEAHPYFWAGFIAIGDMGAIRLIND